MRRRLPEPRAGCPAPFVAPPGDASTQTAAYEAWDKAMADYLAAHPEDAEAVEAVLANVHVPDCPFSAADI